MAFQLTFPSDFGPTFPEAYASILTISWTGGDIDVLVAIHADKAAADAGKVPLKHVPVVVPVEAGYALLATLYEQVALQIAADGIPALSGAVLVP